MSFQWQEQRVLVTGGNGFLGSHLVAQLQTKNPKSIFLARHKEYDLTKEEQVARMFAEHPADLVIHLAGLVGGILPNKERPAEYFFQNLTMGTFMLHYASTSGARHFLAAGAGCGYPENAPNPLREQDFWTGFPQKESAPYSLAKRLLTIQAEAYQRQYGFPSTILIPGNIYGPYDNYHLLDAHVIPALVRKFVEATDQNHPEVVVWGTGKAARDFIYAGDVADGILRAAERGIGTDIINLSSGIETPVRDVIELLTEISGFRGKVVWDTTKPDGQLHRRFDTSKAGQLLDWQATTKLRDGLVLTVDWYRKHQGEARR
jgi:GDP-L-fucose synthase